MAVVGRCMRCKALRILKRSICKRCNSKGLAVEVGNVVPN